MNPSDIHVTGDSEEVVISNEEVAISIDPAAVDKYAKYAVRAVENEPLPIRYAVNQVIEDMREASNGK